MGGDRRDVEDGSTGATDAPDVVDFMIDIETLGTDPSSVILSIGAVMFDIETGEMIDDFYEEISPKQPGRYVDIDTVRWWVERDPAVFLSITSASMELDTALTGLHAFVTWSGVNVIDETRSRKRVWAKPPKFDAAMLENAFQQCSIPVPWDHRELMDLRTYMSLYHGERPLFSLEVEGKKHNALHDAKIQARICSHIHGWLKERGVSFQ
jgi:hypothetical protein